MKITFLADLTPDNHFIIDSNISNVAQAISLIRLHKGDEAANKILNSPHCFILKNDGDSEAICLSNDVIDSNISNYDNLVIMPAIEGDAQVVVAAILVGLQIAVLALTVISIVYNLVISILNSPDDFFNEDPSNEQGADGRGSLFTGPPNTRIQGGSVPLVYGTSHSGGTLISTALYTQDLGTI